MTAAEKNTGALLVEAALAEFNEQGYFGTDTNRIARRAGFAPQTFYRWHADKTTIFLAAYESWQQIEAMQISTLQKEGADAQALARALVAHHREYRVFRRSLRLLTVENGQVRAARAEARRQQLEKIRQVAGRRVARADDAVKLLQVERLCDGLADSEFADLGVPDKVVLGEIAGLIVGLLQ